MSRNPSHVWKTINKDDTSHTQAMECGSGVLVRNNTYNRTSVHGDNVAVSESMVHIPDVDLRQVTDGEGMEQKYVWVLLPKKKS